MVGESLNTNFFTVATGKYKQFVLPYMVSVLWSNSDSFVEIMTDEPGYFYNIKEILERFYSGRFLIRRYNQQLEKWGRKKFFNPNAIRFVETPVQKLEYTYIGDIDILVLEQNISELLSEHSMCIGKCYSNIVRKNSDRLTGLHFVHTKDYYERVSKEYLDSIISIINSGRCIDSDEQLLFKIVEEKHGLPVYFNESKKYSHITFDYRPVFGIHFSPNRFIDGEIGWGVSEKRIKLYKQLKESNEWEQLSVYFDSEYLVLLNILESYIEKKGFDAKN